MTLYMDSRKIGELNGRWAWLLKAMLSVTPFFLASLTALQIYFVQQIQSVHIQLAKFEEWKNVGPRFTASDAAVLKADILATVSIQLASIQKDIIKLQVTMDQRNANSK